MTAQEALYKIRVMLGVEDTSKEVSTEPEAETSNIELAETTLVDGTKVKVEGELAEGKQLLVETPEGDIPAPAGVHETSDGLLIEVHTEPDKSLVDADQTIDTTDFSKLMSDLKKIASVLKRKI